MTDKDLLSALVQKTLITREIAEQLIQESSYGTNSPEDLLYDRHLVDEVQVARVKSELTGVPYKKIKLETVSEELLRLIPQETALSYRVVPLQKTSTLLVVGMLHPDDVRAQEALRFIAQREGVSLGVYLITPSDFQVLFRKYGSYESDIQAAVQAIGGSEGEERVVSLEKGGREEDAPIIKIVASTLKQAVEAGASDVHIEPQRDRVRIRFRIDGNLKDIATLPPNLAQPVISRVKVLSSLKLDETRIPQDGRFRTVVMGRDVDYRVATFPTPSGEKIAIRVLDPTTGLKNFEALGLNVYYKELLEAAMKKPYGMILVSGPTGSGKSTTLYSMMRELNNEMVNIVTLEDPVEYFMDGVNQSQVKPEIGYDFASGLRQILRQDPDVIMVGEIRDKETAGLAVNAALTGHIMLSTIHTNNAVGVIPRLVDLGVPPFLISSALNVMLAQRLVLKLCSECRESYAAPKELNDLIAHELAVLPESFAQTLSFKSPYTLYRIGQKQDCKTCKGKGTVGRLALLEIFRMTRELENTIQKGLSEGALWDEARRQGMITLRQDGIVKALQGSIAFEEVMRETT